jgi:hypothetical protein
MISAGNFASDDSVTPGALTRLGSKLIEDGRRSVGQIGLKPPGDDTKGLGEHEELSL